MTNAHEIPSFDYRQAVERLGLTESRAAELFGTDPATIRRWASGEIPVPDAVASRVKDALLVHDFLESARRLSDDQKRHSGGLYGNDPGTVQAWAKAEAPVPADVARQLADTRLVQTYVEAALRPSMSKERAGMRMGVKPRAIRRLILGDAPIPPGVADRASNALMVQRYLDAAEELAMSLTRAAEVLRVDWYTLITWISLDTPIPERVVQAVEEMVKWQIEPMEWRRAKDMGVSTDAGLQSPSNAELAEKELERDLVGARWVVQPVGTRAARWDAPAARRKPCA